MLTRRSLIIAGGAALLLPSALRAQGAAEIGTAARPLRVGVTAGVHGQVLEVVRDLLARDKAQPGSLSEAEQREVLELQAAGEGGVIVDAGAIAARGLSGRVSLGEVRLDRVHAHGSSAMLTAALTDQALLRRFLREQLKRVAAGADPACVARHADGDATLRFANCGNFIAA